MLLKVFYEVEHIHSYLFCQVEESHEKTKTSWYSFEALFMFEVILFYSFP